MQTSTSEVLKPFLLGTSQISILLTLPFIDFLKMYLIEYLFLLKCRVSLSKRNLGNLLEINLKCKWSPVENHCIIEVKLVGEREREKKQTLVL